MKNMTNNTAYIVQELRSQYQYRYLKSFEATLINLF